MKVGTDSDLLGTMAATGTRILDIGTGTGVLSLIMAQRCPDARITAVEIDESAIKDAAANFAASPFADRIQLIHSSIQDFADAQPQGGFDCVICNPPYFDKSLECDDLGRNRARHTSSLSFEELARCAWHVLGEGGVFSVCIPPEVYNTFCGQCSIQGFFLQDVFWIKTTPRRAAKRLVLIHRKGGAPTTYKEQEFCMLNPDGSRSEWYKQLMADFLLDQ